MDMQIIEKLRYFDKSPSFYQHYASLFSNYFPEISKTIIEELDNIGYEYYHSILLLDSIVDESITKNLPQMVSLQEDAIKRLSQIFSYNCVFGNSGKEGNTYFLRQYHKKSN
jgi:squalene-hopene/tetraprenyl-beta-curcumene cyclase